MKLPIIICLSTAVVLTVLALSRPADAEDTELDAKIEKLMEVTNMTAMMKQMAPQIFRQISLAIRRTNPSIPKREIEAFSDEMLAVLNDALPEFVESMTPIYKKHFDVTDIDAMIAFYETPTGRKAIRKLPALMQESMMIGQAWGMEIGKLAMRRIKERLREKGYKI